MSEEIHPATVWRDDCLAIEPGKSPARKIRRELAVEEPLSILVAGQPVATLMRTPGNEIELATGLLLTEGIVASPKEIGAISFCPEGTLSARNEIHVTLASGSEPKRLPTHRRIFSSCSLCGAEAIEETARDIRPFAQRAGRLSAEDVFALAEAMGRAQEIFRRTGGTHAAALAHPPIRRENSEVVVREDLGRHNALDKAVGAAAQRGLLGSGLLLFLSGRLSFEMISKAARAGIRDVAGVSAPSALGVELARRLNMFVAGFVRGRTMTIYAGALEV